MLSCVVVEVLGYGVMDVWSCVVMYVWSGVAMVLLSYVVMELWSGGLLIRGVMYLRSCEVVELFIGVMGC